MEKQTPPISNLYLIGFMGVGKSYFGRMVSDALNYQFFDTDHEIENNEGITIPEIFNSHGEAYFRKLERDLIESGLPSEACVIACGGGLALQEGIMDFLKSKGVVIALFASEETIIERTSRNKNRPLLDVDDPREKISQMMAERAPKYLEADACIATDGRMVADIMQHIIRSYHSIKKVK